ncbi:PD-(D/E)XK nuclease family protein [Micromonospora sp. NPDC000442]|uniref:PD-(D/E)XK nuclease family protein n=1 Tax=Micromonospora sp. NPDC000442 TaxID=3364217 RepID=UPI0036904873
MTGGGLRFDPAVETSAGVSPQRPDLWSYSSLTEVEACPRRWMLTRAQYPDLWSRSGYPMMPVIAVFGDVVHSALEAILKALIAAGCESTRVAGAAQVLRELGGITAVVERALKDRLARMDENPRLNRDRGRRLGCELSDRVPEARAQVQAYLRRIGLPSGSQPKQRAAKPDRGNSGSISCPQREPIGTGAYPEITLTAGELRLTGRVDLLTVADAVVRITDYKTGAEDPSHLDELRTYALLWRLDRAANQSGRKVTDLMVTYPSREVSVPAPADEELWEFGQTFETRIAAADTELAAAIPTAVTREDACGFCQVRQLCGEYWEQVVPNPDRVSPGGWFDYQGIVGPQNGVRSCWMMSRRTGKRELLLRTPSPSTVLTSGSQIRVLGIRLDNDLEVDVVIGAVSASSEVFVVTDANAASARIGVEGRHCN